MANKRRQFSPEEKVAIVRRHLLEQVANVAGGELLDLNLGEQQMVTADYRDAEDVHDNVPVSITFRVGDGDSLLEDGELAKIMVPLHGQTLDGLSTAGIDVDLTANEAFSLEIKPPNGAVILLERMLPAYIDAVMDFHKETVYPKGIG